MKFELAKDKIRLITNELDNIREHFSVKDETARFRLRGRARFYSNPRIYCITPTGLFEPGLFFDILSYIKQEYPNVDCQIDQDILPIVKPIYEEERVYDNLKFPLRDYQLDSVKEALKFGRGIIKLGTGGGKTLTIASLLMSLYSNNPKIKILILVPDLGLVNQTYKDFIEYNVLFKFTRWTGKIKPDLTANCIIANRGILQSKFDDNDWIKYIDILVVDECHTIKKSNKVKKASKKEIQSMINLCLNNLNEINFFKQKEKKPIMLENLRNIFYRMELSDKETRILSSVFASLGKKR